MPFSDEFKRGGKMSFFARTKETKTRTNTFCVKCVSPVPLQSTNIGQPLTLQPIIFMTLIQK